MTETGIPLGQATRRGLITLLACVLLACLLLAGQAAATGGTRHRDWTVACPADGSGLCIAETQARSAGGASHLQVTRDAGGKARDLVLVTGAAGIDPGAPLGLQVDDKAPLSIRHASAVGRSEAGAYRLQDWALLEKLVGEMRAGHRLRVTYRDAAGKERFAAFSLMGLTASLGTRQAAQPAAGPQGPPDLYPPPAKDGEAETRAATTTARGHFTPAGETPPVGGCYEHQRVQDADGYFTGWLSINRC